ncbi:MAG: ubiquinone/menaquinone biosynthesis methyltransferase [Deltaproteobacteria bacterium]|nr:ubiquinone/menaquinone biosynthesis methyltransferase [Deltaproteobacteria bacterium]
MAASENPRDRAVQHMFNRIARRYDLLNRVISFRLDNRWREQAIQSIWTARNPLILDLGAGTGDLTFLAAKSTGGGRIVGLDFSLEMLKLAQTKRRSLPHGEQTRFVLGSALVAPFRDAVFDGVMSAFVLRNVSDLALFFSQAYRVLRPGGKIVSLDMFPPSKGLFAKFYGLYFYRLVPWIGALLAHDRDAYRYLSESVRTFHSPVMVAEILKQAGFAHITWRRFLCGAVCMHVAERPNPSGIPA